MTQSTVLASVAALALTTLVPAGAAGAPASPSPAPAASPLPAPSTLPAASPSPGASPPAGSSPLPAPSAVPGSPAPPPGPSEAPGGTTPGPAPAPSPTVTPNYTFRFIPKPAAVAPGAAQILEVDLNSNVLRAQGDIDMRVLTTVNVVKVVSRSGGRSGELAKVADGEFVAAGKLPKLPFFVGGVSFNLEFVASTADGRSTSVTIPVKLR